MRLPFATAHKLPLTTKPPLSTPEYRQQQQLHALTDVLHDIDTRVGEIGHLLQRAVGSSYRQQELMLEKRELESHRRVAEGQREALLRGPPPPTEAQLEQRTRREKYIEAEVKNRREQRMYNIQRHEGGGDWREARIARLDMLNIRSELERECGEAQ